MVESLINRVSAPACPCTIPILYVDVKAASDPCTLKVSHVSVLLVASMGAYGKYGSFSPIFLCTIPLLYVNAASDPCSIQAIASQRLIGNRLLVDFQIHRASVPLCSCIFPLVCVFDEIF